jgi:hypothetical protein|tara:strand:+ start:184 stop:417 length:234 start_codon:yes stop_codon:yes gene_type:complete
MNELDNFKKCAVLISSIKKLIGEDVFDESLKDKETEDIYDYIIEKTYETPEYIEEVSFKSPEKIKIAFNKFYYENFN